MPKKSRTRVVVKLDGKTKELFSVIERKNGDLAILPKYEENHEKDSRVGRIKNEHISIHRSPNSIGFLIKNTTLLDEGIFTSYAQFRHPGPDGLAAVVSGHAAADLVHSRYDCKPKKEDDLVYLYGDDIQGSGALFYFLIVLANAGDFPLSVRTEPTILHFENFTILCLSGFLPLLPFRKSVKLRYVTSAPRNEKTNDLAPLEVDLTALSLQSCVNLAESHISVLTNALYKEFLREFEKLPINEKFHDAMRQLEPYLSSFFRYPRNHRENSKPVRLD